MHLPRKPSPKELLNGSWAGQVVDYLRAITLRPGRDYTVSQFANGTTILPRPVPKVQRAGGSPAPFTVVAGDGVVTVVFGTVTPASGSVIVPTIGGISLGADPAPELAISSSGWLYLRVTTSEAGVALNAEILKAATVPENDATHAHLPLAIISDYAAGSPPTFRVQQSAGGSQAHMLCGSGETAVHLFGRV